MGRRVLGPTDHHSTQGPSPATGSACCDTWALSCPCCPGRRAHRRRRNMFKLSGECLGCSYHNLCRVGPHGASHWGCED